MSINLFEEISRFSKYNEKSNLGSDFKVIGGDDFRKTSSAYKIEGKQKDWNVAFLLFSIVLVFLLLISKSFILQLVRGDENVSLADGNSIRIVSNIAERGVIYDKNGEPIARNTPAFGLLLHTQTCRSRGSCKTELEGISKILPSLSLNDYSEIGFTDIVFATGLTKEELIGVEAQLDNFPSVSIIVSPLRDYLYGESFAHVLGYVGLSDTELTKIEGKTGVEKSYDSVLQGRDGGKVVKVDSNGREIDEISKEETIPGTDLTLHIDIGLQDKAYELLKEKIENSEATGGAVVAQDPQNGGVLALASYPSFDPNILIKGVTQEEFDYVLQGKNFPFFNRAISAAYPPASTFKIVMAVATLTEKIVGEYFEVNDTGAISVAGYTYKGWKAGGHGLVDLRRALQVSNDVYFYIVGGGHGGVRGLGIKKIAEWAENFGLGNLTGVDIPGEISGHVPNGTGREWYLGDTYITSIGQGDLLTTPLQLNNMTTYFANGGFLFKPSVVKKVGDREVDTEVLAQGFVDEYTYNVVKDGLKMAVEPGGTGWPVFDFPTVHEGVELAGKTGTAEFGGVNNEKTHAWFTILAPYDNSEIVITVFLEEGGAGSDDAAPIARGLLDYWFEE